MREEGIKGAFESHFWEACDIAHIFGKSENSLAPWNGRELKRRLENLVFLSGLVCMVLPRRELVSDWVLIRLVPLDRMFGTWPSRIDQR